MTASQRAAAVEGAAVEIADTALQILQRPGVTASGLRTVLAKAAEALALCGESAERVIHGAGDAYCRGLWQRGEGGLSAEQAREMARHGVVRVGDQPLAGVSSSKVACDGCRTGVWVTLAAAMATPRPPIVCDRCRGEWGTGR